MESVMQVLFLDEVYYMLNNYHQMLAVQTANSVKTVEELVLEKAVLFSTTPKSECIQ